MPAEGPRRDPPRVRGFARLAARATALLTLGLSSAVAPGVSAQPPKAPAAITQVTHDPARPRPDVPVLVTARGPAGATRVGLRLQAVAPGKYVRKSDPAYEKDWADLPMRDDGREGD